MLGDFKSQPVPRVQSEEVARKQVQTQQKQGTKRQQPDVMREPPFQPKNFPQEK